MRARGAVCRTRFSPRLAAVFALASLGACTGWDTAANDRSGPNRDLVVEPMSTAASPELQAKWTALTNKLENGDLTVHEQSAALRRFTAQEGDDHPYAKRVTAWGKELDQSVAEDRARQAERAQRYAVRAAQDERERKLAEAVARSELERGSLRTLGAEVLFELVGLSAAFQQPGFVSVDLSLASRGSHTQQHPIGPRSLGELPIALFAVDTRYAPPPETSDPPAILGFGLAMVRQLFDERGTLRPAALQRALDEVWVAPDQVFVGAPARAVHSLFDQSIELYIDGHDALRKVGRRRALGAFRKALRADPMGMPTFYRSFVRRHHIELFGGEAVVSDAAHVIIAFWLRRMDDGTDRIILAYLKRVQAAYKVGE